MVPFTTLLKFCICKFLLVSRGMTFFWKWTINLNDRPLYVINRYMGMDGQPTTGAILGYQYNIVRGLCMSACGMCALASVCGVCVCICMCLLIYVALCFSLLGYWTATISLASEISHSGIFQNSCSCKHSYVPNCITSPVTVWISVVMSW